MPFEIHPSWKFMDVMWQLQRWTESCLGLVERTTVICWGIWKNRNEIANERPQFTRESSPNEIKWCPPQLGCYKVNVYGAVSSRRKQVGIGVVIRDSAGEVIAAQSKKLAFPLGVLGSGM
uniref:RNase H type-1 domain-containing protein n=1 Tax=Quercus lobata TaxID=97700 RepID=A0A7N2LP66_QUELO